MPAEAPPRVFICYRKDDTGPTASRLAADLTLKFGAHAVFLDHRAISGGEDWPKRLHEEVKAARVVLVLHGTLWLKVTDERTGRPRLHDPRDWVRREVETSLGTGRDPVPVRVENVPRLTGDDLAAVPSIARLADLQPMRLRQEDWEADLARIVELLMDRGFVPLGPPPPQVPDPPGDGEPAGRIAKTVALGMVALALAVWIWPREPGPGQSPPSAPPASAPATEHVAAASAASMPPPSPATVDRVLEGRVSVPVGLAKDFASRFDRFTIEARDLKGGGTLGERPLRSDATFSIPVRVAAGSSDPVLSWKQVAGDDFVLWPVDHPQTSPPYDGFTFRQLRGLNNQELGAALRDIVGGDYASANTRVVNLEKLVDPRASPERTTGASGNLRYELLQQLCTAASGQRHDAGRSRVTDEQIGVERSWHKKLARAARATSRPVPNLTLALNEWALFSRQVYSEKQLKWPNSTVLDKPERLAEGQYLQTWLREDLVTVGAELAWLRSEAPQHLLAGLAPGQRAALDRLADGRIDDVRMASLVDLLGVLSKRAQR